MIDFIYFFVNKIWLSEQPNLFSVALFQTRKLKCRRKLWYGITKKMNFYVERSYFLNRDNLNRR